MIGCLGHDLDATPAEGAENTAASEQAYGRGRGDGYGELGGLDLDRHCRWIAGPGARSVVFGRTADDWRCSVHGDLFPIDMQEACRSQYRDYNVRAEYGDYYDPYSWVCYAY